MIQSLGVLSHVNSALFDSAGCIHFEYVHEANYLSEPESVRLHILLLNDDGNAYAVFTTENILQDLASWEIPHLQALTGIARSLNTEPVCLNEPLPLEPVSIPKPWGQEIWYSGIESRGVCTTNGVSIAWLLDVFGETLGCDGDPILLKILDPFPDGELGNLYFEMHEQKIEVYVVTHVDPDAWPDGVGQIRYGFNQALMQTYPSTEAFLRDYIQTVGDYRETRNGIDQQVAKIRQQEGMNTSETLSQKHYRTLLARVDESLNQLEEQRRAEMYRFTQLKPIRPGDVITVEPLVPHSLQHGVRVIEFQTPHYERYILSFGQQVLTQDHWDTAQALDKANTDDVEFDAPIELEPGRDVIAEFSAFRAERLSLQPGEARSLSGDRYSMMIGVTGTITVQVRNNERTIGPENAFLNPIGMPMRLSNAGDETATLLIAEEVN